jgi:hypothetical protein
MLAETPSALRNETDGASSIPSHRFFVSTKLEICILACLSKNPDKFVAQIIRAFGIGQQGALTLPSCCSWWKR